MLSRQWWFAQLRREDGQSALEALICVPLMLITVLAFWGVMIVIYNQTVINQAAQLSSQGAMVVYDRYAYRCNPDTGCDNEQHRNYQQEVANTASQLAAENSKDLLMAQLTTGPDNNLTPADYRPTGSVATTSIGCAPGLEFNAPPDANNCGNYNANEVHHVQVGVQAEARFWLERFLVNSMSVGKDKQNRGLIAYGDAFSFAPSSPALPS
jgi:hypothetical protein